MQSYDIFLTTKEAKENNLSQPVGRVLQQKLEIKLSQGR